MTEQSLSVLCAEITGGALLNEKLSAEEATHALERYEEQLANTVEGFRGRMRRGAGSQVIAYFAVAEDALQSAVEIQRRVAKLPPTSGITLGVRVGLCVGHAANEVRFFESDTMWNAAVSLLRFATPGQVLMSVPKRAKGFQWNDLVAQSIPEIVVKSGKRQLGVFELDWRNFALAQFRDSSANDDHSFATLYLHFSGATHEFGPGLAAMTIGRHTDCNVLLHNEKCSRVHARIEYRGGNFVLIDQSTNGTFVKPDGGSERRLSRRELILNGRGRLSFGEPSTKAGAESAQYVVSHSLPSDLSRW